MNLPLTTMQWTPAVLELPGCSEGRLHGTAAGEPAISPPSLSDSHVPSGICRNPSSSGYPQRIAPRVTDDHGFFITVCGVEHLSQFILVFRAHDNQIGDTAEVREIECAVVRRSVLAYDAAPVHGEHDRKVLEAYVEYDLVIGPLEERGVNGDKRS